MKYDHIYRGHGVVKLSKDHRLCVPKHWTPVESHFLFLQFATEREFPCIKVFGMSYYEEKVQLIEQCDRTEAERQRMIWKFASLCHEAHLDPHSRITIPERLHELSQLPPSGDIVLRGCGIHFQIWNVENHAAMERVVKDDDDFLFDLGIL